MDAATSINDRPSVVITSAVRTPIGKFLGLLQSMEAHELGAIAMKEAMQRSKLKPEDISEVIVGQILTAGKGGNPGRQAAMLAGIPFEVPAYTVNILCGSGLKAVMLAYQAIKTGDSKIVVCGGQESMSRAEHSGLLRQSLKHGPVALQDTLYKDALTCALVKEHMGCTAESIAEKYAVSREDQDAFAFESQANATSAKDSGALKEEIVPVSLTTQKASKNQDPGSTHLSQDEGPRPSTSVEALSKLKPVFASKEDSKGTITAGNASGLSDGASFCVLMDGEEAAARGLVPLGEIVAVGQVGVDPQYMGMGPVPAILNALKKAGWTKEEVDLFEINEAFAAQALAVIRELGLDQSKCNVHGGAIAYGHPLGASGAKILTTLLHAMKTRKVTKGVAALCVGGGMGVAICVQCREEWNLV